MDGFAGGLPCTVVPPAGGRAGGRDGIPPTLHFEREPYRPGTVEELERFVVVGLPFLAHDESD
jgi:hypothetical protein